MEISITFRTMPYDSNIWKCKTMTITGGTTIIATLRRLAKALKVTLAEVGAKPPMTVTITKLTQQHADKLLKRLDMNYYRNFYDAFHDENKRVVEINPLWALPEEERSYYLIESYLFGINFQRQDGIYISSFARIFPATPRQKCATCLKFLLQETLFPLCVAQGKRCVKAALTAKGRTVFEELQKDLPSVHIEKFNEHYFLATITCEEDHE